MCVCVCTYMYKAACEEVATEAWTVFLRASSNVHTVSQTLTPLAMTFRTRALVCVQVSSRGPSRATVVDDIRVEGSVPLLRAQLCLRNVLPRGALQPAQDQAA